MKKERTKPTKKRILSYYLIAAACLLVVAAITVGVVFGVKPKTIDGGIIDGGTKPNPDNDDNKKPSEPDDDGKNDPVDTSTAYVFIVPIRDANITQAQVFCYDKTLDRYAVHKGVDFSATAGTEVLAAVDGTVESVFKADKLYGAVITISHAGGIKTVYKFVDPVDNIKAGDKISRGDVIATVTAATGVENMEGDHLHFEVYENGDQVDPDDYLNVSPK